MKSALRFSICAGIFVASAAAHAVNGDLDTSFGNSNGVALAGTVGSLNAVPSKAVVQADGKIVMCNGIATGGSSGKDFVVIRYNPDGSLDTSFSFDGVVTIDFDAGTGSDQCSAIGVQADGKIVAAGTSTNASGSDFAITRLNNDGTLDTSFGAGTGKVTVGFDLVSGTGDDSAAALAIQADGKIVVAGSAATTLNGTDFALVRLLIDGTRDPAFNLTGKVTIGFNLAASTSKNDDAAAIAIDSAGRIVVAGTVDNGTVGGSDFAVARVLPNGQLDANFHSDGRATVAFDLGMSKSDTLNGMTLQRDGRIVLVGYSDVSPTITQNFDMSLARLLPDGSLDGSFGLGGKTLVPFDLTANGQDIAFDVAQLSNDKLLVVGAAVGVQANGAAVRLNTDGSFDNSFGTLGKHVYDNFGVTTPSSGLFRSIAFDGPKIILGGLLNTDLSSHAVDEFTVRLQDDLIFANGFE